MPSSISPLSMFELIPNVKLLDVLEKSALKLHGVKR